MSHSYRFDRFEIRSTERMLYVDGQPASVGGRAINLLLILLEKQGRLVTKSELLDLVWPGLIVEENNLQVQISALRKILGPQAIATVPGRGYRFAMPFEATALDQPGFKPQDRLGALSGPSVLPYVASRLWGRDGDLAALHALRAHALVTVVGAGGIGKTALTLAAAHAWQGEQPDGAVWVELSGLSDPALVCTAVAQVLGVSCGGADPMSALVAALRPLQLLLVLDNAEHLLEAVAMLAHAITQGAPKVRLLVTSQVPLKVEGERVFRLNALSVPELGILADEATAYGAVALFADRAQAADRRFAVTDANVGQVIALCRRLDGIPLAIKLAAARVPLLGVQGVTKHLDERFSLLGETRGTDPVRHHTLRGAMDWSHDLLASNEQAVFRRLCVFAGGFPLYLASAVADDDVLDEWAVIDALGSLVDRSLVAADGNDVPRYRLLESAREYAALRLAEAGEQALFKRRHAVAIARLMDQAYQQYWSMAEVAWLATYGPEIDNVRAALDWAMAHDIALAVDLVGASSVLFLVLGLAPECRQRGLRLEPHVMVGDPSPVSARYWLERSRLHWGISNTAMHDFAWRAADQYGAAADGRGLYLALRCVAGSALVDAEQAFAILDEMAALEQAHWPARLRLQRLFAEVTVLKSTGRTAQAKRVCETLLTRAQAAGLDSVVSAALSDLATLSLSLGEVDEAERSCRLLLSRGRHRRDNFILHALAMLACAAFMRGDVPQARSVLADFVAASRSRDWEWFGLYSGLFALLAALEERVEVAARLLGHADMAQHQVGGRDEHMAQVRRMAHDLVTSELPHDELAALMAEGARMDTETVCALAMVGTPT